MMHSKVRNIDVFRVKIEELSGSSQFRSEVNNVERKTLLSFLNPNYETVLKQPQHLRKITMNDMYQKSESPVHLMFGASNYTKIKVLLLNMVSHWQN